MILQEVKGSGYDGLLPAGIVLTGGGSQLKHLIQLTEYVTGLNARIGLPNEHLAPNHIDELAKPTYATCLGLILKGYDDFEHNRKQFETSFRKVEVPEGLKSDDLQEDEELLDGDSHITVVKTAPRKGISNFWGKFKNSLIDMFKEEEDSQF